MLYLNSLFSVSNVKKPYTLASLAAILNSRIYSACYERFANRLFGDKFPKVSKMDLARLPLPSLQKKDVISLEEHAQNLQKLWSTLRASMVSFREDCNAVSDDEKLWEALKGFWILDRETVAQAQIAIDNSRSSVERRAFLEDWQAARSSVQTIWSNICESEEQVEEIIRKALAISPEVYEQLLVRVPKIRIEDALLPSM